MVTGLNIFRDYFADDTDKYVLIGGAACDIVLTSNDATFPFDDSIAEAFELERSILRNKGIQCTQEIEGYTDFVFLNENGKAFGQSSINRALMRIVDAYNSLIGEDVYIGEIVDII